MKKLGIVLLALVVSGCAFTVDEIEVPYEGRANITVVDGAENIVIDVTSVDKRTVYKDRVSAKKNGYGIECADIIATNDIAKTFSDAVAFELGNLGFQSGPDGKKVIVELVRFYNDFKIGFFTGSAVADGLINVKVVGESGDIIYSSSYEGGAVVENIMMAVGSNAREALVGAMADIVSKVAQDKDLHAALLEDHNATQASGQEQTAEITDPDG